MFGVYKAKYIKLNNKYVITIAVGKKIYADMAVNLAYSFLHWHPSSTIQFRLFTDLEEFLPSGLNDRIEIISLKKKELGTGFSPKLHLDELAKDGQTLFIDSDCLIFENLTNLFERFKGKNVSVIGNYITEGEWFGNISNICSLFKITRLPKFNGGIYYLEKGQIASKVFKTARELEKDYDKIGFVRLRGKPNDEVLMALAMELNNQSPLLDDGTVMSDPQACQGGYFIDVIKGRRWLKNPPKPHPLHQSWYPFTEVSPAVVHFLGHYVSEYHYKRETFKLKKAINKQFNWSIVLIAKINIEYPARLLNFSKKILRPIYLKFFGFRNIKQSERI